MKVLSVDFGLKRIGLAVCDPTGILIYPLPTLKRTTRQAMFIYLTALVTTENVKIVVVGLPLALKGSDTEITRQVRNFAQNLQRRLTIPVHFEDERLSSAAAEEELKEARLCTKKWKHALDSQAAVQILRSWLKQNC